MHKFLFPRLGRTWASQAWETKWGYDHMARLRRQRAERKAAEETDRRRTQRDLVARMEADARRKPVLMSECALAENHLALQGQLIPGNDFEAKQGLALRVESSETPPPRTQCYQYGLDCYEVWRPLPAS